MAGKSLTASQLVLLALGTVVGGSFFLGSAVGLHAAGPGLLLAFAAGGFLVYLILSALSELTTARPVAGSFRQYAELAFGPMAGFMVGWLYWVGLVLALSSEATAAALFLRVWVPGAPLWLLSLGIIVAATALNLLETGMFARVEAFMAGGKLLAVGLFILLGAALAAGLLPGRPALGLGALPAQPWLPRGLGGLAGSMLIVLFTYAGFEVLGLAAPDAQNPGRTVPRAILWTVIALVVLYMGAVAMLLVLVPIAAVTEEVSPLITALRYTGFPGLAGIMNLVVMTAAFSTILAAMYALSRMLHALARAGQAPAFLMPVTPAGAPRRALLASAGAMLIGVVLAFLLPRRVYLFLVSSGGFAILVAYLAILASQLRLRRREGCAGVCRMPGFPALTYVGIALLVGALVSMPLVPGQGAGLVAGLVITLALAAAYGVRRLLAHQPGGQEGRHQGGEDPGQAHAQPGEGTGQLVFLQGEADADGVEGGAEGQAPLHAGPHPQQR